MLAGLTAVAATAGYFYVTSDGFRDQVAGHASSLTGRKTKIANVSIDWGSTARVQLAGVEVANPDWSKQPHMLKAEQIDFELKLWPLLKGDLVLPLAGAAQARGAGRGRRQGAARTGAWARRRWRPGWCRPRRPTIASTTPMIGRLEISDGKITYRDPKRKLELDGTISTAQGKAGDQSKAELHLKGKLQGQALALKFVGGSVLMLRDTTQPYPIDLDVTFGGTKLVAKGTVQDPFKWTGANVDLDDVGTEPVRDLPDPRHSRPADAALSPHAASSARMAASGSSRKSKWRVGDSDLAGDVTVDERKKPAFLTAKLVSNNLAFKDLAPLIGAPPGQHRPRQRQAAAGAAAARRDRRSLPEHAAQRREAPRHEHGRDARRQEGDRARLSAGAGARLPRAGEQWRRDGEAADAGAGRQRHRSPARWRSMPAPTRPRSRPTCKASDMELQMFFRNSKYFDTTQGKIQARVYLAVTAAPSPR